MLAVGASRDDLDAAFHAELDAERDVVYGSVVNHVGYEPRENGARTRRARQRTTAVRWVRSSATARDGARCSRPRSTSHNSIDTYRGTPANDEVAAESKRFCACTQRSRFLRGVQPAAKILLTRPTPCRVVKRIAGFRTVAQREPLRRGAGLGDNGSTGQCARGRADPLAFVSIRDIPIVNYGDLIRIMTATVENNDVNDPQHVNRVLRRRRRGESTGRSPGSSHRGVASLLGMVVP